METFKIEIQESLSRVVEVKANNSQEAFSKINESYFKAEIVLDYNDFVQVDFIDINSQSKKDELNELVNELIDYMQYERKQLKIESNDSINQIFEKLEKLKTLIS